MLCLLCVQSRNPLSLPTPKQCSLASPAGPDFFLDSLPASCGTLALFSCLHTATPVLSLGSDLWSLSLSSQTPPALAGQQRSVSGWWVLVSTDPLYRNLSAWPSAPLLLHSPPWLWSFHPAHHPSPPVKGLPSVWKLFFLHSSLPEVQVPSLFFCLCFFFFLFPYPGTWGFSCLLGSLRSSASVHYVFCRSCSTCRCIFDVFVGRKVISMSYSSAILKVQKECIIDACNNWNECLRNYAEWK